MNDRTIHAPASNLFWPLIWLIVASGFVITSILNHNLHFAYFSVLPFLLSLAGFLGRRGDFRMILKATGLDLPEELFTLDYSSIDGVSSEQRPLTASSSGKRFAIDVFHSDGVLRIPANIDAEPEEIYQFLLRQLTPTGSRSVHPSLLGHLARQIETFGADKVFSFRARTYLAYARARSGGFWTGLAIFATGLIWIGIGATAEGNEAWLGCGVLVALFSGLITLGMALNVKTKRGGVKNWRESSIVVSPLGIAMNQGALKGELRWNELRDVKLSPKLRSFQISSDVAMPGIHLIVEGARIVISDLYDRPLPSIHGHIVDYWKYDQQPPDS